jgi:hypothetical protein
MPIPVVAGDIGGPYVYPSTPPVYASFPMMSGSVKTFFNGRSVMLFGQAFTGGGPIISATLMTTKTFVEGRPVLVVGSMTMLGTGWLNGVLQGGGAPNVFVN